MKNLISNALVALTILPLLGACGKSGSGASSAGSFPSTGTGTNSTGNPNSPQNEEATLEEDTVDGSSIQGLYRAQWTTLNPQINGTIPGSVTFRREGDSLRTYLRLFAGKPKAWHQQAVHVGKRCPTIADDTNADGFIDINEAMAVVGQQIIPLDADMNSQASGKNFYPVADLSGFYDYEREASFSRMFSDIKSPDKDPSDMVTKLGPDDKFSFVGRAVMVQGVDEATLLPETVGTTNRRRPFQNLPVACGIIAKHTPEVGTPYNGEISGPIGDVMEGQDQPAPADDTTTTPGTTTGGTGGTVSGTTTGSNETHTGQVGNEGGTDGGATTGGSTVGGTAGGTTTGGSTTGGSTVGGSTTGGTTTGGTTGGESTGGTSGGRSHHSGGFIGGFIGGSSGGSSTGGFIGGFIGGSGNGTH